MHISIKFC